MNIQETAALLAKIKLGDNREVTQLVIAEWHDTIGHLDYTDAVEAVRMHRRESTEYLGTAHIVAGVRRIVRERERVARRSRAVALPPWLEGAYARADARRKGIEA